MSEMVEMSSFFFCLFVCFSFFFIFNAFHVGLFNSKVYKFFQKAKLSG